MEEFSGLSIKKLNQVIRAKASQLPEAESRKLLQRRQQVYEKDGLVTLCQEFITWSEVEALLSMDTSSPRQSTTSSTTSSTNASQESANANNMNPDQLRQQAQAMRQNPSAFRFMQTPPLSEAQVLEAGENGLSYTDVLRKYDLCFVILTALLWVVCCCDVATQMEQMASDPAMFQRMKDQMANMR